ncbi:NAD(P)/FAD-dependent oxidoreductase [Neorhizobium galegae]|uniref:NAD(P)/FAD-dependent oxidoreductase n=1 Tax=Neorhizobium galegae TaxID=399 RepID=UPI0021049223|nr:NAD(P)/FAD-dependent oxidoreductase [Neorhizobium galegae]MCQ1776241.1 NAD(P)/FAD-dependent oxidoreductase [Neorhizobium galegae]MCQ1796677.1 NAD(P)/FAD-dependent oxidoreductase [Neorhizobium galegae]
MTAFGDFVDAVIIGAGVVGCAMARRFSVEGASVVVLERAPDILSGASKANSAILHTGFDAPPGSVELQCMQSGYDEYMQIRESFNLPILETGAMVAAWDDSEEGRLPELLDQALLNGVADARLVGRAEVLAREPALGTHVRAALLVPREIIIDPWSAPLAYAMQAKALGARFQFNAGLLSARFDGDLWHLETPSGTLAARSVINSAGIQGDSVERMLLGEAQFEIRPRKGQFVVFDKAAAKHLRTILLPVPTARTKGVVLTRTIFGNLLVGPTAEEQEERERPDVTRPELDMLIAKAVELVPALAQAQVTAVYAGLRPASEEKHYRVHYLPEKGYFCAGGIRSTGLTAALGIARHVHGLWAQSRTAGGERFAAPPTFPLPNLAEHLPRDWQTPGHDGIVCHCEMVTGREIEAALGSPLPPGDFGGLRRRTRCAMGRCQGFNCLARLASLTEGRLSVPIAPEVDP